MKIVATDEKRLKRHDIIGRKILRVYETKGRRIGRFQSRETFVHLDNEVIFDMDSIRDPKIGVPLNINACEYKKLLTPVLSIEKETNLDSPVKSIVFADHFENGGALLLENQFVLTVGIGEFDMGYTFYLPSKEFRNYVTLEIPT